MCYLHANAADELFSLLADSWNFIEFEIRGGFPLHSRNQYLVFWRFAFCFRWVRPFVPGEMDSGEIFYGIKPTSHVCRLNFKNLNCFPYSFSVDDLNFSLPWRIESFFPSSLELDSKSNSLFDNDVCDLNFGPFAFYLQISFSGARTKIKSEFLLEAMCKVDLYRLSVAREVGFLQSKLSVSPEKLL